MPLKELLLHTHAVATIAMFGLIWLVQLCQYPGFSVVGSQSPQVFAKLHHHHMQTITYVVMPLMLLELGSASLLAYGATDSSRMLAWSGLALVGAIWLSTALLQVPMHTKLGQSYDAEVARKLVNSNWIRTICWTARCGIAIQFYRISDAIDLPIQQFTGF